MSPTVLRALPILTLVAALGAPAAASPRADALARHSDADVAALRAQRDDAVARCTLGAIYARRGELPRAALYLAGCEHAELPDDLGAAIRATARNVRHQLDASRLTALAVLSQPEGLTAEISALPGETFTTPATVWVPPGDHVVRVTRDGRADQAWTQHVTAEPHKNTTVIVETTLGARPAAPRTTAIDLGDDSEGQLGEQSAAPPPDIKHPSLLKDKYRGIADPSAEGPIDDPLADPFAHRDARAGDAARGLGLRFAAGMFDDGAATARAGLGVALVGRVRIARAAFVAVRADWTRRGGDAMTDATSDATGDASGDAAGDPPHAIDVLGAAAGLGVTVLGAASSSTGSRAPARLGLAVIGQLRGDLRLATRRDGVPVRRAGLGVAAGAELALPATPLTVGLRVEQGLTELVAGARDRAVLVELGVDLR